MTGWPKETGVGGYRDAEREAAVRSFRMCVKREKQHTAIHLIM